MPPRIPRCSRVLRTPASITSLRLTVRALSSQGPQPPPKQNDEQQSSASSASDQNVAPSSSQGRPSISSLLAETSDQDNSLLAPVHIPEDPNAVLKSDHPARNLLAESGIIVQRQLEMMNIFLGFEQANKYVILDPHGNHLGYMAEHDGGIAKTMGRKLFRTHVSFTTHVFDRHSKEVLRVGLDTVFHKPKLMDSSSTVPFLGSIPPSAYTMPQNLQAQHQHLPLHL